MPVLSLTQREIKRIVPPQAGHDDYFDTELKGFLLRVSADYQDKAGKARKGSKVFYVQAGVLDPATGKHQTRKAKVGAYGELTPDEARGKARLLLQQLRAGQPTAPVHVVTLAEMLGTYLYDHKLKPSTERAYKSEINSKFSSWLEMPLTEVNRIPPDVMIDRFQQVGKNNGPMAAKASFEKLQALLNYAKIKFPTAMPSNPCSVITDAGMWPKVKCNDDCMKGNDFKTFAEGLGKFNEITQDCYLFTLYQGLRNVEAASLRWEYVDLEKELFDLSWMDSETKHRGVLPLSRQSLAILKRRLAQNPEGNPFAFPSLTAHNPSKTGHVALKATLLQHHTGLRLTVHGLRRSFFTIGKKLRLHEEADRLTNHVDSTVTGKHYDGRDVDDLRQPLQAIANEMERLMVHGTGGKVVELATARATVR